MQAAETLDIQVTHREPGYGHVRLSGTCGPDVTKQDIEALFFHPIFEGRGAWVTPDGRWGVVVHTD